jgi:hypothetical protein
MCLNVVKKLRGGSGIGYKIVRPSDMDIGVFFPMYSHFGPNGGEYSSSSTVPGSKIKYRKVHTVYIVGRTTKAEGLKRLATAALEGEKYPAGIHLFKVIPPNFSNGYKTIKCRYKGAIATDGDVVVASEVTVLKVIE